MVFGAWCVGCGFVGKWLVSVTETVVIRREGIEVHKYTLINRRRMLVDVQHANRYVELVDFQI